MSTVWLVATREMRQKVRSRAFRIVTLLLALAVVAGAVLPGLLSGDETSSLGVVGDEAAAVGQVASATEAADGVSLDVARLPDEAAARDAVRAGDVDAALLDGRRVLVVDDLAPDLRAALQSALFATGVEQALADAGVAPQRRATLLAPPPLDVRPLDPGDAVELGPEVAVGAAAAGLLYGLLIFWGQQIASGIVEEKQNRVVEVLLATLRPTQLLGGKVLGLGLLGLAQVALLSLLALGALQVSGTLTLSGDVVGTVGLVVAWYVLGFAFYATLFALAGAVVSRVEDLQSSATPVILLLVASLLLVQFSFADPTSTVARVAGLLPPSAPLAQPLRQSAGVAQPWEVVLAVAITLAVTAALVPLAGRVYSGAALATRGRTRLRTALRTSSDLRR